MKNKPSHSVKRYPTDLNDKKKGIIKELLPEILPNGRPRIINF